MVQTTDEIITKVKELLGDNATSDESIELIENISDSMSDSNLDWKEKYEENDKKWRQKYVDRFNSGESNKAPEDNDDNISDGDEDDTEEVLTYDKLFTES